MATIRVRALKAGFSGGSRIRKDDVFSVDEKQFSKRWMERVPDDTAVTKRVSVKKVAEATKKTLSLPGGKSLI